MFNILDVQPVFKRNTQVDLPIYDILMYGQINLVKAKKEEGSLDVLLNSGEAWEVK